MKAEEIKLHIENNPQLKPWNLEWLDEENYNNPEGTDFGEIEENEEYEEDTCPESYLVFSALVWASSKKEAYQKFSSIKEERLKSFVTGAGFPRPQGGHFEGGINPENWTKHVLAGEADETVLEKTFWIFSRYHLFEADPWQEGPNIPLGIPQSMNDFEDALNCDDCPDWDEDDVNDYDDEENAAQGS